MTFWLRCGECYRELNAESAEPMQLALMFKPSLVPAIPRFHPHEQRCRCRNCGYVSVLVPAAALTESWRDAIVLK